MHVSWPLASSFGAISIGIHLYVQNICKHRIEWMYEHARMRRSLLSRYACVSALQIGVQETKCNLLLHCHILPPPLLLAAACGCCNLGCAFVDSELLWVKRQAVANATNTKRQQTTTISNRLAGRQCGDSNTKRQLETRSLRFVLIRFQV